VPGFLPAVVFSLNIGINPTAHAEEARPLLGFPPVRQNLLLKPGHMLLLSIRGKESIR
jgi:hypothetical protein